MLCRPDAAQNLKWMAALAESQQVLLVSYHLALERSKANLSVNTHKPVSAGVSAGMCQAVVTGMTESTMTELWIALRRAAGRAGYWSGRSRRCGSSEMRAPSPLSPWLARSLKGASSPPASQVSSQIQPVSGTERPRKLSTIRSLGGVIRKSSRGLSCAGVD